MTNYEAILLPGGGLTGSGEPTPWSQVRLDRALSYPGSAKLVVLGFGTPHKPPPRDSDGFPIHEAGAAAKYLINSGCNPERIVMETSSVDTIGNAFFARTIHVEPRGWRRLLVITSQHHMDRTRAIFETVFSLPRFANSDSANSDTIISETGDKFSNRAKSQNANRQFLVDFDTVPDVGMDPETLKARCERERLSLTSWLWRARELHSLEELSCWLFKEHACYAVNRIPQKVLDKAAGSY